MKASSETTSDFFLGEVASRCRSFAAPSSARHRFQLSLVTACISIVGLLFAASSASAAYVHSFAGEFGSLGSGDGQFNLGPDSDPDSGDAVGGAIAIDQASGGVYVADTANNRIEKFDAAGHFLAAWGWGVADGLARSEVCTNGCQAGIAGSGPGQFNHPAYLAIDNSSGPSAGDVYVASATQQQYVQKFSPSGSLISTNDGSGSGLTVSDIRGIAVDFAGRLWVYDYPGYAREFDQSGAFINQFKDGGGIVEPRGIAVDSADQLYLRGHVDSSTGELVAPLPSTPNGLSGVGIDPSNGDVYLSSFDRIDRYDAELEPIERNIGLGHIRGENIGSGVYAGAMAPAISVTTKRLYVVDNLTNSVLYFDYVIVPDIQELPPSQLDHDAVTVNAHVDPVGGGSVTGCTVEYGLTTDYEATAPCGQATPFSSPEDVSSELSNLTTLTTYHYRFVVSNAQGTSLEADHTVVPPGVLGLRTETATELAAHGATLNGSLDPAGEETEAWFEYGIDTTYGQSTPTNAMGSSPGETGVPPAAVTGLQEGRVYHFRIVASNSYGTTFGPDDTFTTRQRPAIEGLTSSELTSTEATLEAEINPHGLATTYRFEYGTSINYGQATPAPEGALAAANSPQAARVRITGLQPNVTYHYRLVASSAIGDSMSADHTFNFAPPECPNATVRQQTGAAYLPDCRAYELVSPPNAGGIQMLAGVGLGRANGLQGYDYVSPNSGDASSPARFGFFAAFGQLPGTNPPNVFQDEYVSTRTLSGWVTTYPGLTADKFLLSGNARCDLGLNECIVYHLHDPFFTDSTDVGSNAPYLFSVDGSLIGRLPTNAGAIQNGTNFDGTTLMSPDFGHLAFSSRNVAFASGGKVAKPGAPYPGSAYDNDIKAETVSVISKAPGGADITREAANATDEFEYILFPAISTDGSHILMSTATTRRCHVNPAIEDCSPTGPGPVHLYMRVNDSVSYDVSGGYDVHFVGMTPDGSKVFFTTAAQVTSDDHDTSVDLYMWSQATDSIVRISAGEGEVGNSDSCQATWTAKCDVSAVETGVPTDNQISDSGDIYFYSPESLTGEKVNNQRNLYVYRGGQVHYVATLAPDSPVTRIQVSPDGAHAGLLTASSLTSYDTAGHQEMYSYEPGSGDLICVSCRPDGDPPATDVAASGNGRFMSDDGRLFFSTGDPLVPQDTDGLRDVYEYVDGGPHLISSGTSIQDTWPSQLFPSSVAGLEAVSRNGVDVFFSTFDTLVPQDHNGQFLKFYDARTGGGFPVGATPAPCAAADECHGVGGTAPAGSAMKTEALLGAGGNSASGSRRIQKHSRRHRHDTHKRHRHDKHKRHRHRKQAVGSRGSRHD